MSTEGTDARQDIDKIENGDALSSSFDGNIESESESESDDEANSGEKQSVTNPTAMPTSSNEAIPGLAASSGISQLFPPNSQNPNVSQHLLQFSSMGILGANNGGIMDRSDHHLPNPMQGAGIGTLPPPPPPYPSWRLRDPTAASGLHAPQEIQFQGVLGRPGGESSNHFPYSSTQQMRMNMQNQNGPSAELELGSNWIRPGLSLGNSCYSPIYEEMGLPVDPHLRMFLVKRRQE